MRGIEFLANSGGVAVEADARFPDGQPASHGFFQSVRCDSLIAGSGRKGVVAREVAYEALVEMTVLLKDPGLRVLSEDPTDGKSQRVGSVGD